MCSSQLIRTFLLQKTDLFLPQKSIFEVSNHIIHSFMKLRTKRVLGLLGLAMLLSNSSVFSQKSYYNLTLDTFPFSNAWVVNATAEKGSFMVPENRSKTNGKTLKLKFVRLKSKAAKPLSPVFFYQVGQALLLLHELSNCGILITNIFKNLLM